MLGSRRHCPGRRFHGRGGRGAAARAVAAANAAVEGADALPAAERAAFELSVSMLEGIPAQSRAALERARATETGEAIAALKGGDRIAAISVVVKHGAAPVMTGTVPGSLTATVTGLETAAVAGSLTKICSIRRWYVAALQSTPEHA